MRNVVLLFFREFRIYREAQILPCHALSYWEIADTIAEVSIRGLEVDGINRHVLTKLHVWCDTLPLPISYRYSLSTCIETHLRRF